MHDWTDDRYECIQYLLGTTDHGWVELNKMSDKQLSDMVRYDLAMFDYEEEII